MGNQCDAIRTKDNTNVCDADGIVMRDRNFCVPALVTQSIKPSMDFCNSVGDREFILDPSKVRTCYYDSTNPGNRMDTTFGCCGLSCAIVGTSYDCKRIARRGRPKSCCYRDRACSSLKQEDENLTCFDSNSKMRSCPNDVQDLSSETCQEIITDDCSGPDWRANWLINRDVTETANPSNTGGISTENLTYTTPNNPICVHALWRNVYGASSFGCQGISPPNVEAGIQVIPTASGIAFGRKMMNDMYAAYTASGGSLIAREDQQVDTEMNNLIYNICSTTPGLCTDILQNTCATVTVQDLKNNPTIQKICGCSMKSTEYSRWTDLYNISRECTPPCNLDGVIPQVDETGIQLKKCKQSTCVIDNVSIDLYKSRVGDNGNGISINQICSSCSGNNTNNSGTCKCSLTGLTIISAEATISGGINISQACGSTDCSIESKDSLGNITVTKVPCSSDGVTNPNTNINSATIQARAIAEKFKRTKILILLGIVVVILIIVWLVFTYGRPPIENTIIYNRVPLAMNNELGKK